MSTTYPNDNDEKDDEDDGRIGELLLNDVEPWNFS